MDDYIANISFWKAMSSQDLRVSIQSKSWKIFFGYLVIWTADIILFAFIFETRRETFWRYHLSPCLDDSLLDIPDHYDNPSHLMVSHVFLSFLNHWFDINESITFKMIICYSNVSFSRSFHLFILDPFIHKKNEECLPFMILSLIIIFFMFS